MATTTLALGIDASAATTGAREFSAEIDKIIAAGTKANAAIDALASKTTALKPPFDRFADAARTTAASVDKLGTESADTSTSLDKIDDAARRSSVGVSRLDSATAGLAGKIPGLTAGLKNLAAGMIASFSFGAILNQAQQVTQFFDTIVDSAQRVGASAEQMQALRRVFIENASSAEELATGMENLRIKVGDAEAGNKTAIDAFARLGITTDDLAAASGNGAQQLEMVATAISSIESPSQRAAALQDLLGRAGKGVETAMMALSDTLDERVTKSLEEGSIASNSMAQAFADLADRQALLNEASNSLASGGLLAIQRAWIGIQEATLSAIGFMEKYMVSQQLSKALEQKFGEKKPQEFVTGGGFGTPSVEETRAQQQEVQAGMRQAESAGLMENLVAGWKKEAAAKEKPASGGGGSGRRGGGGRVRAGGGGGGGGAARPSPRLDLEFGKAFESADFMINETEDAMMRLTDISASALTKTQQDTVDMLRRINEAHLQAHGGRIRLIEIERDEQLKALSSSSASQEDKARARVQIEETASQEIMQIRRQEAAEIESLERENIQQRASTSFGSERKRYQVQLAEMERDARLAEIAASARSEEQKQRASSIITDTTQLKIADIDPTPMAAASKALLQFGEQMTGVEGMTQGVIQGIASIGATATSAFADAIVSGESFSDVLDSLATSLQKMIIQMTMQIALQQALGQGASLLGAAMAPGAGAGAGGTTGAEYGTFQTGVMLAKGGVMKTSLEHGVYTKPTYFLSDTSPVRTFADGGVLGTPARGLLGEAGPEAVLPLKRKPDGSLGVQSEREILPIQRGPSGKLGVRPMAMGGVVEEMLKPGIYRRPTYFRLDKIARQPTATAKPFSKGASLAGESSLQAILPLRRSPGGELGVEAGRATLPLVRMPSGELGVAHPVYREFAKGGVVAPSVATNRDDAVSGFVVPRKQVEFMARGAAFESRLDPGVYDKPTYFPLATPASREFAKGTGLLGESGPEAVLPLSRGPSGKLGVESTGGKGSTIVNVQINNMSRAQVETEERPNESGGTDLMITLADQVEAITAARAGRSGTRLNKSITGIGQVRAR